MTAPADRLSSLLSPVVAGTGADLEDLSVSPAGRRRVVRVVVDRDGGVNLDDVAEISRLLSEALDDVEAREPALLGGAYVLEVSSPGVDRPLTQPRHWRRNVGRLVTVTPHEGGPFSGRLLSADDETLVVDGKGIVRTVALTAVAKGVVQVEFDRKGDDADDLDADDVDADDSHADADVHDLDADDSDADDIDADDIVLDDDHDDDSDDENDTETDTETDTESNNDGEGESR